MQKRIFLVMAIVMVLALLFAATASAGPNNNACWGQATKVFAQTEGMGEHASQQPNPRLGLRNLARDLYASGVIEDDSMQALGVFVVSELGLTIEACGT